MKRRHFLSTTIATSLTVPVVLETVATPLSDPTKPFLVKAGQTRNGIENPIGSLKVSGKDTNEQFCLFESINSNGPSAGPPLHIHLYQDEVFMILEGEFVFQVGTERVAASAGDVVFGPRNVPHTYYQKSKRGRMLFSYNRAGKMEAIMEAMPKLMPGNPQAFAKLSADNDVPFVGPPMKLD